MSAKPPKSLVFAILFFLYACASPAAPESPPAPTATIDQPVLEPTPTPTEAPPLRPVAIPSGMWEGIVTEPGLTYPIHLVFTECGPGLVCGSVDYDSYGCGGTFTLLDVAETELTFEETIEYGVDQCFSGATVRMWAGETEDDRLLSWGPDAPTAEIHKTGEIPTPTPAPTPVSVSGLGAESWSLQTGGEVNYQPVAFEGSLWVPLMNTGKVLRIDIETGELLATIETGKAAFDFCCSTNAVAAADGGVWVTQAYEKEVVKIDPATNEVVERIPIGANAYDLAFDGEHLWVTGFEDSVVVRIDLATSEVVAVIEDVMNPTGIAIGGGAVWVVEHRRDHLVRIDPETNSVVLKIKLGDPDREVGRRLNSNNAVFAFDAVWIALNADESVARVDPETNEQTRVFFPGMSVSRIAAGEDGIWAALYKTDGEDASTNKIARIDPETNGKDTWTYFGVFNLYYDGGILWVVAGEPSRPGDRIFRFELEN